MKPETLTTLKKSIEHWKDIRDGKCTNIGSDYCSLCKEFNQLAPYCKGCPIYESTGKEFCKETPFENFTSFIKHNLEFYHSKKYKELAQAMLDFLISLIPKGEDMSPEEKQIQKLRTEIDTLEEIIKNKKENKKWFPEDGDNYYSISSTSEGLKISTCLRIGSDINAKSYQMLGGIFKTEKEAVKEIQRLQLKTQIIEDIDEANEGWVPDWKDFNQTKWFFESYEHEEKELEIDSSCYYQYNKYPAKNSKILEEIIEKYGAKEVALALEII